MLGLLRRIRIAVVGDRECEAVAYPFDRNGLAVNHFGLVLELPHGSQGSLVEGTRRIRFDDHRIAHSPLLRDRELEKHMALDALGNGLLGVDRRHLHDGQGVGEAGLLGLLRRIGIAAVGVDVARASGPAAGARRRQREQHRQCSKD